MVVLYFSALAADGAAALSTVEFAAQALPTCEFLLASKERDEECWGAFRGAARRGRGAVRREPDAARAGEIDGASARANHLRWS